MVRMDGTSAHEALSLAVPQIRMRARANPAVRTTYSSLLAYMRARYPGRYGHAAAAPAEPPATTEKR